AELPPGVDRNRAYRLRAYVLAISKELGTSPDRLAQVLTSPERAGEVYARFRQVHDDVEPYVRVLWDFLSVVPING
ncbi:MAG: hypothetical protein AAFU61_17240, partial [Pseudomonadota bacterium]